MPANVLLAALAVAAVATIALAVRAAWRDRSVDFISRHPVGPGADAARDALLDRVAPVLVAGEFRVSAHVGHTTIFERRWTPVWTMFVAVFVFPIGLLALFHKVSDTVALVATDGVLEVHGRCPKRLADLLVAEAAEASERHHLAV